MTAPERARVRVLAGHRPALAGVAGRQPGQDIPGVELSDRARRFAAAYAAEGHRWGLPVTRAERKRALVLLQGGARS